MNEYIDYAEGWEYLCYVSDGGVVSPYRRDDEAVTIDRVDFMEAVDRALHAHKLTATETVDPHPEQERMRQALRDTAGALTAEAQELGIEY